MPEKNQKFMPRILFVLLIVLSVSAFPQLKEQKISQPSVVNSIVNQSPGSLFNIFSPEKFRMNHSYNMSYTSFAGGGLALGVYTNSMLFKLAENMSFQVDASMFHSPYNTFGKNAADQLSGFSISSARFDYKPTENMLITVQYQNLPYNYYSPFDSYYQRYNPFLMPSNELFTK